MNFPALAETETPQPDCPEDVVWNFAFGSNLHPEKREGRANLCIDEVVPGCLPGWRLAFNLKSIRWLEPSMAGIEPDPDAVVHGVLLRFSPEEFRKLVQSEGDGHSYELVQVEVQAYDGRSIQARAFRALPHRKYPEDVPPSLRYLTLIREGARRSQLSAEYVEWLDGLPHTEKSFFLCWVSRTLMATVMWIGRLGYPQFGAYLFRTLRWIDHRPRWVRVPLNFACLTPVLSLGVVHGLLLMLRRRKGPC